MTEAIEKVEEVVDLKGFMLEEQKEVPGNVERVPSHGDDIMVFARTPEEMARAQSALITWASNKTLQVEAELAIAKENLEAAKDAKIRTAGWQREVKKHEKSLRYYEKIHAALIEGYFIVPDFPIQILAVRTTAEVPTDQGAYRSRHGIDNERHEELPAGEGEYKDSHPKVVKVNVSEEQKDGTQNMVTKYTAENTQLQTVDFPFRLIRPHLLKDLKKAMEHKIFDAIGVLPNARADRDPMLVGVIENRKGKYNVKSVQFLISWWIPTASL